MFAQGRSVDRGMVGRQSLFLTQMGLANVTLVGASGKLPLARAEIRWMSGCMVPRLLAAEWLAALHRETGTGRSGGDLRSG